MRTQNWQSEMWSRLAHSLVLDTGNTFTISHSSGSQAGAPSVVITLLPPHYSSWLKNVLAGTETGVS